MNFRILLLKTEKLSDFLKQGPKLFYSIIVNGRIKFLKKLCFVFRRGMLRIFRVKHNERLVGIKVKRFIGF